MNRREFLGTTSAIVTANLVGMSGSGKLFAQTTTQTTSPNTSPATLPGNIQWHDVREWGVEGKAFADTDGFFDRLPARARSLVREPLWNLSRHSAGMSARFRSNADTLFVRYTLLNPDLSMPHMPASGMSGLDLYARQGLNWHWVAALKPTQQSVSAKLIGGLSAESREYQLNLPLYNGVKSLEIGTLLDASFEPLAPRDQKPILFYGTSITQGGCASRPGMAFVSIVGRRLDVPTLNLGFSGNGRMETEIVQLIGELDPSIFVIDCCANMTPEMIQQRTIPLVRQLRDKRPQTPILLMEQPYWCNIDFVPEFADTNRRKQQSLRGAFDLLMKEIVPRIHYRAGQDLFGTDGECTVDGVHPTDVGMMRIAEAIEPDLRRILAG